MAPKVGSTKVRSVRWAGDDLLVVIVSTTEQLNLRYKYEFYQAIIINLETRSAYGALSKEKGVYQFIYGWGYIRQIEGRWYGYYIVAPYGNVSDYNLYRVDLETGDVKLTARPEHLLSEWVIGADGAVVARIKSHQETGEWALLLGDQGGTTVTSKKTELGELTIEGFGRTPGTVLVQDSSGDKDLAEEFPLKAGALPTILLNDVKVSEYIFDPRTHLLIGALTDDSGGTVFFDSRLQARFESVRRAFRGYQVQFVTADNSFDKIVVHTGRRRRRGHILAR